MAYVETGGLAWPFPPHMLPFGNGSAGLMDATGEKFAMIGRVAIAGHPGGTKTLDTSGSSKIAWYGGGTAVFDNASTTLDVGIQGVNTSGPPARPDGSYSVKATVTTAADASPTLTTTNSWHSITPTTGTATLTEGDLIAVVWDLTNRAGSDAINVTPAAGTFSTLFPITNAFASAAWAATGSNFVPNCLLTFSDGTLGWLDDGRSFGVSADVVWNDGSGTDEYGMIFQVPFDCKADAIVMPMRISGATSDLTVYLSSGVSSGASTRSTLASVAVDAAQLGPTNTPNYLTIRLASEITLTANTDYCVSVKATGAGDIRMGRLTLGDGAGRAAFSGGTTLYGVSANNGGEFGAGSTTLMYPIGVRISQVSTGSGGGSTSYVIGS
jgi:hypothetical protein